MSVSLFFRSLARGGAVEKAGKEMGPASSPAPDSLDNQFA
jgi:hypothetical protein